MTTTLTLPEMLVTDFDNSKGRADATVAVPAGRYYLGDPCYPFPNDGPHSDKWMPLLRSCWYFGLREDQFRDEQKAEMTGDASPVGTVTVNGTRYEVLGFGTQYGDGGYPGSDGFEYGVDAGLLGLVPMALVEALGEDAEFVARVGTVYESETPFTATREADGTLTFGTVTIKTGDPTCESCDTVLDCFGYCGDCDRCDECGETTCGGAYGTCENQPDEDEDED